MFVNHYNLWFNWQFQCLIYDLIDKVAKNINICGVHCAVLTSINLVYVMKYIIGASENTWSDETVQIPCAWDCGHKNTLLHTKKGAPKHPIGGGSLVFKEGIQTICVYTLAKNVSKWSKIGLNHNSSGRVDQIFAGF